ncbi:helix-turn-helix transcriptional regulator [Salinisphaera sp. G21_0]|uniref:helix-turn-helix domain-containing protein n=1 Tax=Salinisphaera sp. G21_0 TaxID=2821094 RepID=UPI00336A91C2
MQGLNRTYIGDIERGEKNLTLASIEKLARVLGVKIRDFFDWDYLFSYPGYFINCPESRARPHGCGR